MAKIISCKAIGKHQTYDLEVDHPDHQFYLANGVLTSNSHAMAYAYNSYHCSWLYTYYEKEWIKACLECDPELEKTIATTRMLGYSINKVDVNLSAVSEWSNLNMTWNPPLTSLKGVGLAGAQELKNARPDEGFANLYDFFYNVYGNWRWTKLNKKIIEALIKAEAFGSLNCVGPDCIFKNYKHMFDFIVENWEQLKKKKVKFEDAASMVVEDWQTNEKIAFQRELLGFYDKGLIVKQYMKLFKEFDITAIDEYGVDEVPEGEEYRGDLNRVWAIVESVDEKKTANGKPFLAVKATGMTEKPFYFRIWAMSKAKTNVWEVGNVVTFSLDYDEQYGYSLSRKSKVLRVTR